MGEHAAPRDVEPELWRVSIDIVLAVLNVAALILIALDTNSVIRPPIVIVAFVIGSGWALSAWVTGRDISYLLTMTMALGTAWCIGLSMLFVGLGYWHPVGLSEVVLLVNAVALGLIARSRLVRSER